jgi:hypothetical protein
MWPGLPSAARLALGGLAAVAMLTLMRVLQGMPWPRAVMAALLFVAPCVLLGWVAWQHLARHPAGAAGMAGLRTWAAHAGRALAFSAAWIALFGVLAYAWEPQATLHFLRGDVMWLFFWGLVVYGALAQAARTRVRLRERELAAAQAELQALRAQLDPHFLFNTLHSLTQLAQEDPGATQAALQQFGDLMRYVLDAGRRAAAEVALEDELGFVRNYLALERLRLGERLQVREDIDPDALELAVPPLLLQPLVENAVRHGLAPRRAGGTLRLVARVATNDAGDVLLLEVSDDGRGAAPQQWQQATGLGLQAVRRQLQAHVGSGAGLHLESRPGAGFSAHLRLPARIPRRRPDGAGP